MHSSRLRALACIFLIAAFPAAAADAPPSVFLEDLTSPELAQRIRAGSTTAIIPIGGTEQNGAHMALGKHNVRVRALAGKIAQALGNAIVAPVIAYVPEGGVNPPTGHMRYPGTITVSDKTYRDLLDSAARSLKLAGFRDIVLLGDHGGYQKDDEAVAQALNHAWTGTGVRAHAVTEYYRASTAAFAEALQRKGYAASEVGMHAGLADTSLALAVDPSLVRGDRLQPSPGVTGNPARASASLGNAGVDIIVAQTVAAIRAAPARP
ncbi:MAG TPA: creatininase family protein [Casimicrobiaceae bacterium]|nr:creatininase family protein [Casimicrobiaceae bacterium]